MNALLILLALSTIYDRDVNTLGSKAFKERKAARMRLQHADISTAYYAICRGMFSQDPEVSRACEFILHHYETRLHEQRLQDGWTYDTYYGSYIKYLTGPPEHPYYWSGIEDWLPKINIIPRRGKR